MTREEAKQLVLFKEPDFLGPPIGEITISLPEGGTIRVPSYVCPFCGYDGGTHEHKGQALRLDPITVAIHPRWKCFHCEAYEDVIGLWKAYKNVDWKEAFDTIFRYYNIKINDIPSYKVSNNGEKQMKYENNTMMEHSVDDVVDVDYSEYFKECVGRIRETDYHRGISFDTLVRFGVGYDPKWKHPKVKDNRNVQFTPRLIIPTSKHSYVARDTRKDIPTFQEKYKKSAVGKRNVFNEKALYEATKPIFVVEGEIDALSIIDVGGEAIGIGGVGNRRKLLKLLEDKKPIQPLIIAFDDDKAGNEATKKFESELSERNILFYRTKDEKWTSPFKDPNEWLVKDREKFSESVRIETEIATEKAATDYEDKIDELKKECVGYYIDDFFNDIRNNIVHSIPTGFEELDKILDGGLNAGLYIIGAISSLGKTTFCLQVADNIAKEGYDVLIFSLEMARKELIAKSISRLTFMLDSNNGQNAKTTRGILKGGFYKSYSDEELRLIDDARKCYKEYADRIFIVEGVGTVTAKSIFERVKKHKETTGRIPVVIVDYLQIISPEPFDTRSTDKQIIDKTVLTLKRLSRDFSIPVIGISSFNRDNYWQAVSMTSFKESGAIEYSSDVLIGLQYKVQECDKKTNIDDEKQSRKKAYEEIIKNGVLGKPLEIQLRVLKNRNGARGDIDLCFYPMFNIFKKCEENNTYGKNANLWVNVKDRRKKS